MQRTVVLHIHRGRKVIKIKSRWEWERGGRQNESEIQKSKVRIIYNNSQARDHFNFV